MKKILLINAKKQFSESQGQFNTTLHNTAKSTLLDLEHEIVETTIDDGYNIEAEVKKYLWADVIIYQMPVWWMGMPWILKKYLDEVLTAGYQTLYSNDGRTRSDLSKKYGSGGLAKHKKYMISVTWNAPLEAFTDPKQFFEGKSIDEVYFHFHKIHQFLAMSALPTFMCNDVSKNPDIDNDVARYEEHLRAMFAK